MKIVTKSVIAVIVVLLFARQTFPWNATGHKVIVTIAWAHMTPTTRQRVIALLKAAPEDSGILELCKGTDLECFENVSIWADQVRGTTDQARKAKYNHATWHYINYHFEETPNGIKERPDLKPDAENVVTQLTALTKTVAGNEPASQRAVQLAWILHMRGDIAQPLHCVGRVTETEPTGDAGGNQVRLARGNLHGYWDGILNAGIPKKPDETDDQFIERLAKEIQGSVKDKGMRIGLPKTDNYYELIARAGFMKSMQIVYTPTLKRNEEPSAEYKQAALTYSEGTILAAGLDLADFLNGAFGR